MNKCSVVAVVAFFAMILGSAPASEAGAVPEPPAFWHLGLVVADLDSMDRFYADVIGLQRQQQILVEDSKVSRGDENAIVVERLDELMGITGTRIEIRHYSDPRHPQFLELLHYPDHPAASIEHRSNAPLGLGHLGLGVPAIDPILARMEATGLGERVSGPQRLKEFGGLRYAFLKDPEGNLVELMEMVSDERK